MIKQKNSSSHEAIPFQTLPCDSPQIKPSSSVQQVQDINLEEEKEIEQMGERNSRRKKHKAKKTKLIKIKPIENQQRLKQDQIQYLPETQEAQKEQKWYKKQSNWQINRRKDQWKQQELQSPVLYRISDEQDLEQREQDIPKSSRRPLNQIKKHTGISVPVQKKSLDSITSSQRKSESDEPDSPVKLIQTKRNNRSKQQSKSQHTSKFMKMKQQIQQIQKRQPTQVYQYQDSSSSQEQPSEQSDQANSEQYHSQNDQNHQHQLQTQFSIKPQKSHQHLQIPNQHLPKSNKHLQKPQITVFKSTSFYTLINAEIPKGNFVNCIIRRKRTDQYFQKTITYELFLLQDKKYLMTCTKNRLFKTTSHFEFYREKPNAHKYHHDNLYAFMDSNFTGTEFVLKTIHRNDTNSERSTAIDKSELLKMQESTSVISDQVHKGPTFYPSQNKSSNTDTLNTFDEKEVLFLSFKANFFGFAGQRQVKMLKKKNKKLKVTGNFSDLRSAQQNGDIDKYTQINSKKAIEGKNGLELDFKGIAQMQSTKNIILEGEGGKEALIFGKIKEDIYAVSIGSPLSIIEGLGFGIANLDRKFFVN